MIVKKHPTQDRRLILALCDDELLGRRIEENDKQLDLSSDFYRGDRLEEDKILELVGKAYMVNAVGEKSVRCCLKAGLIDKEMSELPRIAGVPYLQWVCA